MRIIALSTLKAFWAENPRYMDAKDPTLAWHRHTLKADWAAPTKRGLQATPRGADTFLNVEKGCLFLLTADMSAADAFRVLKSGGLAGVVQHRAPEDADDVWADGSKGYLKQSRVIQAFKKAGFVLENASEINANRKDQPTESDFVWRLLPSNKDDATAQAIGESDRMTLVFRKP